MEAKGIKTSQVTGFGFAKLCSTVCLVVPRVCLVSASQINTTGSSIIHAVRVLYLLYMYTYCVQL